MKILALEIGIVKILVLKKGGRKIPSIGKRTTKNVGFGKKKWVWEGGEGKGKLNPSKIPIQKKIFTIIIELFRRKYYYNK